MQIGGINSFRSASDKLIDDYQLNHAKYDLFLHGYVMDDIKQQILHSEYLPTTSTIELSPDEVYKVVEKGDIGFICYNSENKNFFYTKFASGQIVEFLRCSKPVIVFGHSNMKEFVNDKKIGVGIDNISDLATAIDTIAENYTEYQDASKKYFDEIYNIELYLNGLGEWVYD